MMLNRAQKSVTVCGTVSSNENVGSISFIHPSLLTNLSFDSDSNRPVALSAHRVKWPTRLRPPYLSERSVQPRAPLSVPKKFRSALQLKKSCGSRAGATRTCTCQRGVLGHRSTPALLRILHLSLCRFDKLNTNDFRVVIWRDSVHVYEPHTHIIRETIQC